MAKLTNAKVKSLKKPGLHTDGQTLYLRVAPGGSKAWVQRSDDSTESAMT